MTADQDAQRLEDAMHERRLQLGLKWNEVARRAGISTETLFRFRKGMRTDETTYAIERALEWQRGSIEAALAGGEPTPIDEKPAEHADQSSDMVSQLLDLTESQQQSITELLRKNEELVRLAQELRQSSERKQA